MSMFCYQCQETGRNEGCEFGGVCGKSEDLADLQDLLLYILKGISEVVVKGNLDPEALPEVNRQVIRGLFMTITNANFDEDVFRLKINELLALRDQLRNSVETSASVENSAAGQSSASVQSPVISFSDAALFRVANERELVYKASFAGAIPPEDEEDVRSLKHLMLFGLKGLAAYTYHAYKLGKESMSIYSFIYEALAKTLETGLSVGEMLPFVMKTGEVGVEAMALLDQGNTTRFGSPEITKVNIGVGKNPGILISGHDLTDLEQLLEQTQGTGVDIYTHSEMLPAHYYPQLKKYENLVGNYGNAWWQQEEEFVSFRGPVLFTTNCIVPPLYEEVKERIFTTGASGFPGCKHISADANGKKDFRPIIELAKGLQPPTEIEQGTIIGGFAHGQVLALADQVISAVKSGAIKKFVVMAGCDGRMESREYYTEFANALPKDTVILTAGCAKYRYNKLNLGDINGIPRVLDAGQCNDSFSLVMIALKLKEVFQLEDINDLPIAYNISWYEQKAVLVLLALLYLGVKNIHLGPTLPAFLSPNIASFLVENFGIAGITTVDEDLKILI